MIENAITMIVGVPNYRPDFSSLPDIRNAQEVFNHVVRHLFRQGKPATSHYGSCLYRVFSDDSFEVVECGAVGALIPPSRYSPRLEGKNLPSDEVVFALGLSVDSEHAETILHMLGDLQAIHDDIANVDPWRSAELLGRLLRAVGEEHGQLDTSIVDQMLAENAERARVREVENVAVAS